MSDQKNTRVTKRQYWQDQINAWQDSKLSQSDYCAQSGVKLSTFSYWLSVLLKSENKHNQFAKVKIIKDKISIKSTQSIQIKLLSGHVVHLPIEMGMKEVVNLICLIGLPHA